MNEGPPIGTGGGQRFKEVPAIRTILSQMGAEPAFSRGPAVIKELIQNADDAGASELTVVLDERTAPQGFPQEYQSLIGPALLVWNDKPFRKGTDADNDDFLAICDVAGGHKLGQATAAGRFGIGFNSVYFLTDTPIIFSRREVHVFDLLHLLHYRSRENGWKFPLEEFRAHASVAGPLKQVLDRALPKSILRDNSFGELAQNGTDYQHSVFRLPFRQKLVEGERLADETFPSAELRQSLLKDICLQAAQSLLFLKSVVKISISRLLDKGLELVATISIDPNPSEFEQFKKSIERSATSFAPGVSLSCGFYRRAIELQSHDQSVNSSSWSFFVKHTAHFDSKHLTELRKHLHRNGERAIPWVSLAIPENPTSLRFEGDRNPYWRVFLPLGEEGPCGCILNAHLFVGPSRQRVEFRASEASDEDGPDDEGLRKTSWNQALVDEALIPLLSDASAEMLDLIPQFVEQHAREYLSLLPRTRKKSGAPASISAYVQQQFGISTRILYVYDLWKEPLELLLGQNNAILRLEMIPEPLAAYRALFKHLQTDERRFVTGSLGKALREYLSDDDAVNLKWDVSADVAREILKAETAPNPKDIVALLKALDRSELTKSQLQGLWCFQLSGTGEVVKFDQDTLYLAGANPTHETLLKTLRQIGIRFAKTEWVNENVGLCALSQSQLSNFDQVLIGDDNDNAFLTLLRHTENADEHDQVSNPEITRPLIEFLCAQSRERLGSDLQLGFLVTTATNKRSRRSLGTIFLKPRNPTRDDEILWEGLLRRTFPEVDPRFAEGLHKLIDHAPELLHSLDAKDCRLELAAASRVLEVLNRAMELSPSATEVFAKELSRTDKNQSPCRNEAYEAALLILEDAERRWDQLGEEERTTVLSLPIHRLADGSMISLLSDEHPTRESLKEAFFLQSEDDLSDAPLELEKRTLLHSVNRIARRFYRTRLQISEDGRVEVLKEALRQVGSGAATAEKLLEYIARHYDDTIEQLKQEGAERQKDVDELSALFIDARIVPCLDGIWRRPDESVDGSVAAAVLKRQGWRDEELEKTLISLAHPRAVATLNQHLLRFVGRLRSPDALQPDELGGLAISSEAEDFGLRDRAKVFLRNKPTSSVAPLRASRLDSEACPALDGMVELKDLELLEIPKSMVGVALLRRLFPNAANIEEIARQLGVDRQEASTFLKALKVPVQTVSDLDEALQKRFYNIWPHLNDSDRFELLDYVGTKDVLAENLRSVAATLDVIKVDNGKWVCPTTVLSPEWASTRPPVSQQILSKTSKISEHITGLWNKWCGVNTIGLVVESVVTEVQSVPSDSRVQTWKQMIQWLKRATSKAGAEVMAESLKAQAWVLAKKGSEVSFHPSDEVLFHAGADVLSREFWVVHGDIPSTLKELVKFKTLQANAETLEAIAECLSHALNSPSEAVLEVYREVARLVDQQGDLAQVWKGTSEELPVYRLFRASDRSVSGSDLFLGDRKYATDFGEILWCFSDGGMDKFRETVRRVYKQLDLGVQPSTKQLLSALSSTCGQDRQVQTLHRNLVEALTTLAPNSEGIESELLSDAGVLSCSGTYEPLGSCYRDDQLRSPELIEEESRPLMIDGRDRATNSLLKWIGYKPAIVRELSLNAHRVLSHEPSISQVSAELTRIVQPWRSWLGQLANEDSVLRSEISKATIGWDLPSEQIEIVPVDEIRIRYELKDDGAVLPSSEWWGPQVCHDSVNRVLIAKRDLDGMDANKLEKIDELVMDEVFDLLRYRNGVPANGLGSESFKDIVNRTLERPSVLLGRMKSEKEEHFFHQYLDQAADPEFADTFDEYHQLSQASPRRRELSGSLWNIIADKFVRARREQIRGYGYDEFSIFAELTQNAEDAYAQRLILEMSPPDQKSLTFSYSIEEDKRVLAVDHWGRPFNHWIQGAKSEPKFKRDVERVLSSAGSFKRSAGENQQVSVVGRFGLGFKSVYLITSEPIIYSGDWHFLIKSGCIPIEVEPPEGQPLGMTRLVLPLLDEAQEEEDRGPHGEGERFVNLMPFLRHIDELNLKRSDGSSLDLHVGVSAIAPDGDDETAIELVQVSGASHVRGATVDFIRLRSRNSDAQLALYLGEDGLPAPWKEAFLWDVFAVLPLRVELGCGVAVSHMFQVQSGRTHLIDPEGNRNNVAEVSALIQAVPQAMNALLSEKLSSFDFLRRFWGIWRWDRGDNEASDLRRRLASKACEWTRGIGGASISGTNLEPRRDGRSRRKATVLLRRRP